MKNLTKIALTLLATTAGVVGFSSSTLAGEGGIAASAAFSVVSENVTGVATSAAIGKVSAGATAANTGFSTTLLGARHINVAAALGSGAPFTMLDGLDLNLTATGGATIKADSVFNVTGRDRDIDAEQANRIQSVTAVLIGTESGDPVVVVGPENGNGDSNNGTPE